MERLIYETAEFDYSGYRERAIEHLKLCNIESPDDSLIDDEISDLEAMDLWDEKDNLDMELPENVVAFGSLVLSDGTKRHMKELGDNLNCFLSFDGYGDDVSYNEVDHEVVLKASHNHGPNTFIFRQWKEGTTVHEKERAERLWLMMGIDGPIMGYTKSLSPYIAEIYGPFFPEDYEAKKDEA